jgi:hypothetical protein
MVDRMASCLPSGMARRSGADRPSGLGGLTRRRPLGSMGSRRKSASEDDLQQTEPPAADAAGISWAEALAPYGGPDGLFSPEFLGRWGEERWKPSDDDGLGAAAIHAQVASRISTQPLGYADGVEMGALRSLRTLFDLVRAACERYPAGRHLDAIVLDVLNRHLRPFTSRWHPRAEAGKLAALDASDEFRAELSLLQPRLAAFDDVLLFLRDGRHPPAAPARSEDGRVQVEMAGPLPWGIAAREAKDAGVAGVMDASERLAIERRRKHYRLPIDKPHAVGLALSGGGVRSATFSLGVLVALARRNVLPQIDYLSTVSGGGFAGAFLTAYLNGGDEPDRRADGAGLERDAFPFRREDGEAEALRFIRHRIRYLAAASHREAARVAAAQLQGLTVTVTLLAAIAAACAMVDFGLRRLVPPFPFGVVPAMLGGAFWVCALAFVGPGRWAGLCRAKTDAILGAGLTVAALALAWDGLGLVHASLGGWCLVGASGAAALTAVASVGVAVAGRRLPRLKVALIGIAAVSAPVLMLFLESAVFDFLSDGTPLGQPTSAVVRVAIVAAGLAVVAGALALVDVNEISPHRHYRDRLAAAFLVRRRPQGGLDSVERLPMSEAALGERSPYHLVNCALNVPDSRETRMQGRPVDFFLFSPAMTGSSLTGYADTKEWEALAPELDLATAIAISGAAAAPQMGFATVPSLRFWLALLNVRLGQWIQVPASVADGVAVPRSPRAGKHPGLTYLLLEMTGLLDERRPFVNLTDGGHIENLGVYELLRRRCKFIVAVDGEQDPNMTFGALTTLQRLAAIDLGVDIEIDLDDLRLAPTGLSRSHFRFCRVHYPARSDGRPAGFGYLLYVKLSLTGNEGEFIKRYRLDEPTFPHHPTADQFFTEAQFEAYRSLGEHVGEKLFLPAVIQSLAASRDVGVEEWFAAIGRSLLDPPAA